MEIPAVELLVTIGILTEVVIHIGFFVAVLNVMFGRSY
jgi:hypothetical protein